MVKTTTGGDFTKHRWQEGDGSQRAAVLGGASAPAVTDDRPAGLPAGWVQRADGSYMPPGA